MRVKLPGRRVSETFKRKVNGRSIFVGVGYSEEGNISEIWIDTAKEGTELRTMMNAFAMMTSLALQFGAPVDHLMSTLLKFPQGELTREIGEVLKEASKCH